MLPIRDHNPSHKFPLVTLLLIAANIFVFFLELTAPNTELFIHRYALIPADVSFTDFSTLYPFITSMFMHAGFLHIISNMWFLWIFGDNVEVDWGRLGYLVIYLFSGIIAALSQFFFTPDSTIPMLGASGAVAGVLGSYLVRHPRARIETLVPVGFFITTVNIPASIMLGYWFVMQFFAGYAALAVETTATGGVAFFAHIGGFITGFALAKLK